MYSRKKKIGQLIPVNLVLDVACKIRFLSSLCYVTVCDPCYELHRIIQVRWCCLGREFTLNYNVMWKHITCYTRHIYMCTKYHVDIWLRNHFDEAYRMLKQPCWYHLSTLIFMWVYLAIATTSDCYSALLAGSQWCWLEIFSVLNDFWFLRRVLVSCYSWCVCVCVL